MSLRLWSSKVYSHLFYFDGELNEDKLVLYMVLWKCIEKKMNRNPRIIRTLFFLHFLHFQSRTWCKVGSTKFLPIPVVVCSFDDPRFMGSNSAEADEVFHESFMSWQFSGSFFRPSDTILRFSGSLKYPRTLKIRIWAKYPLASHRYCLAWWLLSYRFITLSQYEITPWLSFNAALICPNTYFINIFSSIVLLSTPILKAIRISTDMNQVGVALFFPL